MLAYIKDLQDAKANTKLNSISGPAEEGRSVEAGNALPTTAAERKGSKQEDNSIVSNLQVFILDQNLQQFYLILGLYGFCFSLVESLLFIVLEKDYHASKTIQGLHRRKRDIRNSGVSFFRQFIGEVRCQANVCDSAECVCVTADTVLLDANLEPEMVVFIQLLHGFCFAVMWVAAVQYAKANAPESCKILLKPSCQMYGWWATGAGVFLVVFV